MRLASYFKKGNVLTVTNGMCQAMDKGIAFIEYLPKAKGLTFAVDAEAFINALKVLKDDYRIVISETCVTLFDQKQEIQLKHKPADISIELPSFFDVTWEDQDITIPWSLINEFVNPSYPAIKYTGVYFETITSESAVRVPLYPDSHTTKQIPPVFILNYKIPKGAQANAFTNSFLWIKYSETCYIALSIIEQHFPSTDSLFQDKIVDAIIPNKLITQLAKAERVTFKENSMVLISPDIADQIIEKVYGQGTYSYALFAKALKYCIGWSFKQKFLFMTGQKIQIILENLDA